jgi:hypothetical protein
MSIDYEDFWSAIAVVAKTFRHDDPQLSGKLRNLSAHLRSLPADRQEAIRNDLQLLLAQFITLPLALNGHNDSVVTVIR